MDILSRKKSPPLRFIYCNEREGDLGTPILYFFKIFFSEAVILRYLTPIASSVSGWTVYPGGHWAFSVHYGFRCFIYILTIEKVILLI